MEVTMHYAPARRDPHFDHLAGHAERVEPDKRVALEPLFLDHLRNALGIRGVKRVRCTKRSPICAVVVLDMDRNTPGRDLARALRRGRLEPRRRQICHRGQRGYDPDNADALVVGDVLPRQPDLACSPADRDQGHGPRQQAANLRRGWPGAGADRRDAERGFSRPISLSQARVHGAANPKAIWEGSACPSSSPELARWYVYSLGEWPDELERAAAMAVKGDYFETGSSWRAASQDVGHEHRVRDGHDRPPPESDEY